MGESCKRQGCLYILSLDFSSDNTKIFPMRKIILLLVVLASCQQPIITKTKQPEILTDVRLNGRFVYKEDWEDKWGIEESHHYHVFRFDGTTKRHYYFKCQSYSIERGWTYSGDYIGDSISGYEEIALKNVDGVDYMRIRSWSSEDALDWCGWEEYLFSSDLTSLEIGPFPFRKE